MNHYINYTVDFMNFITKGKKNETFYLDVDDNDIERYMISIRRQTINGEEVEIGDDMRATRWSALNTFFKFLAQKKHIINNPMLLTERPKIKTKHTVTYMNQDEIKSVFNRIKKESKPRVKNRDTCIVALGLSTGLRVSAIVNIDIEDIDFKENIIKVVQH